MYDYTKTKAILTLATIIILSGCGSVSSTEKSINQETSELTLNPIPERTSTSLALKLKFVEDINTQENSTIIKWELTKHATGQIEYGFDNSYGEYSVKEESFKYDTHTIPLNNLEASTTYHYRVVSEDAEGNKVISNDEIFKTKGNTTETTIPVDLEPETVVETPIQTIIPSTPINTQYEISLSLPACDSANPEVQIISQNSDWSMINDQTKRIFCVRPGDYSQLGAIKITTHQGSKDKPRYIVLFNGNNTHTGKLNKSQLARVRFSFENTGYWIVDRMAYWNDSSTANPILLKNSNNIVINRYFLENTGTGIYLYPGSNNNTIQNSRFQKNDYTISHDRAAVGLLNNGKSNIAIKNTKVINNEIVNYVDAFQAIKWNGSNLNYEGTIVSNNDMYVDSKLYSDCSGHQTPTGSCSFSENAIDLKSGSSNPQNPMIITNNRMWGFKKSDRTNTSLSDWGTAVGIHYGVNNVVFENNIIFNSDRGISIADPREGYAMRNSSISKNILYNINGLGIYISYSDNIKIEKNIINDISNQWLMGNTTTNSTIKCNAVADSIATNFSFSSTSIYDSNIFYNTLQGTIKSSTDDIYSNIVDAHYNNLSFITDKYTNNPKTIVVPSVLPTSESPQICL